ncbi:MULTISPECIES: hypothetical protein [unclassified Xanthobacter]|uniref:hypothetical protein n=1 Tax=unclassified Xanthobacter TaxID=2623496 RepID=UPI001EE0F494|nr:MULTISPECIES: hypothetical protein [unclassified Xanthobacter]
MSVAMWPTTLPQLVLLDGYEEQPGDGRLFFEPEAGPPLVRPQTQAAVQQVAADLWLDTLDQREIFLDFWRRTLSQGALPFWRPDPVRHGVSLLAAPGGAPLLTAAGLRLLVSAWWLCQFGRAAPRLVPLGGTAWRVSTSLLVLP